MNVAMVPQTWTCSKNQKTWAIKKKTREGLQECNDQRADTYPGATSNSPERRAQKCGQYSAESKQFLAWKLTHNQCQLPGCQTFDMYLPAGMQM